MDVSAVAQAAPEWVRAHTPGWLAAAPSWVSAHTPDLPPRGAYRWERERGAHLENRSRPGTSRRRRAQVLARAAHRGQRTGLGVGESQVGDDLVPSWWRRAIAEQDAGESLA
ncbi:MAG: hypothetical protein INR62_05600, partial [Rhodospirillales bacterium]|nr:hypothetical protein [Acetobacter sp.]